MNKGKYHLVDKQEPQTQGQGLSLTLQELHAFELCYHSRVNASKFFDESGTKFGIRVRDCKCGDSNYSSNREGLKYYQFFR